jgi:hypothetical protein
MRCPALLAGQPAGCTMPSTAAGCRRVQLLLLGSHQIMQPPKAALHAPPLEAHL